MNEQDGSAVTISWGSIFGRINTVMTVKLLIIGLNESAAATAKWLI